MIERTKYVCPYCGYDKVEMVLSSYHCDKCGKRTSVYDVDNRDLYERAGTKQRR